MSILNLTILVATSGLKIALYLRTCKCTPFLTLAAGFLQPLVAFRSRRHQRNEEVQRGPGEQRARPRSPSRHPDPDAHEALPGPEELLHLRLRSLPMSVSFPLGLCSDLWQLLAGFKLTLIPLAPDTAPTILSLKTTWR